MRTESIIMNDLQETYKKDTMAKLISEFNLKNSMQAPRLIKIVINCGMGEALRDKKVLERMSQQLSIITGQKPQVTKAKRAISTFKLRAGDAIGLKATLRGERMWEFMTKLVTVALPRVRDFRGVSKNGFDHYGNYTLGIREQTIFPDLDYSQVDKVRGFEVTFVTSAIADDQARRLLELLGLPFEKE